MSLRAQVAKQSPIYEEIASTEKHRLATTLENEVPDQRRDYRERNVINILERQ